MSLASWRKHRGTIANLIKSPRWFHNTVMNSPEELRQKLPDFLSLGANVTGDSAFSMFNLSLRQVIIM